MILFGFVKILKLVLVLFVVERVQVKSLIIKLCPLNTEYCKTDELIQAGKHK
jgi:hypothetical protein